MNEQKKKKIIITSQVKIKKKSKHCTNIHYNNTKFSYQNKNKFLVYCSMVNFYIKTTTIQDEKKKKNTHCNINIVTLLLGSILTLAFSHSTNNQTTHTHTTNLLANKQKMENINEPIIELN